MLWQKRGHDVQPTKDAHGRRWPDRAEEQDGQARRRIYSKLLGPKAILHLTIVFVTTFVLIFVAPDLISNTNFSWAQIFNRLNAYGEDTSLNLGKALYLSIALVLVTCSFVWFRHDSKKVKQSKDHYGNLPFHNDSDTSHEACSQQNQSADAMSFKPQGCDWQRQPARDSESLNNWKCKNCAIDAFTTDGKPPKECKRNVAPGSL